MQSYAKLCERQSSAAPMPVWSLPRQSQPHPSQRCNSRKCHTVAVNPIHTTKRETWADQMHRQSINWPTCHAASSPVVLRQQGKVFSGYCEGLRGLPGSAYLVRRPQTCFCQSNAALYSTSLQTPVITPQIYGLLNLHWRIRESHGLVA